MTITKTEDGYIITYTDLSDWNYVEMTTHRAYDSGWFESATEVANRMAIPWVDDTIEYIWYDWPNLE